MNTKEMMAAIVTAIMVLTMFAVMVGPAAAFNYSIGKSTLTEPGGTVDNGLEYIIGQQVNYSMYFTPTSEDCVITSVKDIFPDGTEEDLASGAYPISLNQYATIGWETTWVVNSGGIGVDGKIVNNLEVKGFDADDNSFIATAPKSSNFNDPPTANFTFAPGDCGEGVLDATTSTAANGRTIVSYEWDLDNDDEYDDATGAVIDPYTRGGLNYVCLKVTDDLGQSNTTCQWVLLTGCPVAVAKADGDEGPNIQLQDGGEMVEFSGADSYHPDDPDAWIVSYAWVIGSKTSDLCTVSYFIDQDTTAELTVTDNFGCKGTDTLSLIVPPPQEVPIVTPAGMVVLVGMLCIVGAGVIRKGGGHKPS